MYNRIYNSKNPYQGNAKKVLCVCSAGLLRSPTAAVVLNKEYGYNTRSCGMDQGHALIIFDDVLAEWADEIIVMSKEQYEAVPDAYKFKTYTLGIRDSYAYMDKELQKLIKEKYDEQAYSNS